VRLCAHSGAPFTPTNHRCRGFCRTDLPGGNTHLGRVFVPPVVPTATGRARKSRQLPARLRDIPRTAYDGAPIEAASAMRPGVSRTKARSEEVAEFLGGHSRLAQDRAEGAALQISVVVRHGYQHPRSIGVFQVAVATPCVMHKKASSPKGADELAGCYDGQIRHAYPTATATVSLMMCDAGCGSSAGGERPSLAKLSK